MVRQLVAAALVGWCGVAWAENRSGPPTNVARERLVVGEAMTPNPIDEAARAAMRQVIELKLDDTSIANAIDQLRDLTGAKVFVNWKALEAQGIGRKNRVVLHVRNVRADTALDLLLRVSSPERPRLGWVVDNGVVTISTDNDLSKYVMIRVYDVRDILDAAPAAVRAKKVEALLNLLSDRVDPKSWKSRGGTAGAIRELQGQLIVTQTPENHRQIIELLESLRPLFAH